MVTTFYNLKIGDDNLITPASDQVEDGWDDSYSVQAYSRIYVSLSTIDNIPHGKLTRATGGWRIADYTVNLSNREVSLGSIGLPPEGYTQVIYRYPAGNTFDYTAPSSWIYVNRNGPHQIGANSVVTLTKGSSVWELLLMNHW